MSTLTDYIKWRGDLSFHQDKCNDFDNLVFSAIAYVDLNDILSDHEKGLVSLCDVSNQYFEKSGNKVLHVDNPVLREAPGILRQAAMTKRYGQVYIRNYTSETKDEENLQFAAMEFVMTDGNSYIAFRGTDDTIVGWKEDFLLAATEVESEKKAVDYVYSIMKGNNNCFHIGGHSKGGHLAVYAAVRCPADIQDRILNVYTNDGPGFSKGFAEEARKSPILDRIVRIIPEYSVVGMLLESIGKTTIVKSTNKLILQHDLMTWELDGPEFVTVREVSKTSKKLQKSITTWLDQFEIEERDQFIDEIFAVLESSGKETFTEVIDGGLKSFQNMTKHLYGLSENTRDQIGNILKIFLTEMVWSE